MKKQECMQTLIEALFRAGNDFSLSKAAQISWKARILIIWFAIDRRLFASKWRDNDC